MKNFMKFVLTILIAVAVGAVFSAILAYPAMLLWNWLAPILSNGSLPTLNYWQIWGLIALLGA